MYNKARRLLLWVACVISGTGLCAGCLQAVSKPIDQVEITRDDITFQLNDTRVYQSTRYDGPNLSRLVTYTNVITEQVVYITKTASLVVAQIHYQKSEEQLATAMQPGDPIELLPAAEGDYWVRVEDQRIYQMEQLNSAVTLTSTILYELPFQVGDKWYLSDLVSNLNPTKENDSMLWRVVQKGSVTVPAGHFESCFLLTQVIGGTVFQQWFCSGVGIVEEREDHHGTPFGSRRVLSKYQIQEGDQIQ